MKTLNILFALVFSLVSLSINAQSKSVVKETVKVWGNCGMCQSNIEKAAKTAGATTAKWDVDTHILSVSYNTSKTSIKNIEEKIAATGYDTKNVNASTEAYNKLHGCCQYERKAADATAACCKDGAKCEGNGCCDATKASKDCCSSTDDKAACCTTGKSCCAKA
jgi:hypothetical protein